MSNGRGYLLPDEHQEGITGYICVPVPINREYRRALIGALTSVTRWFEWEKTGDNRGAVAAEYMRRLLADVVMDVNPDCGGGIQAARVRDCIPEVLVGGEWRTIAGWSDDCLSCQGCGGGIIESDDMEDDDIMPLLSIEDRDGVPFLRLDCGCGTARYFSLTETGQAPGGGPLLPSEAGSASTTAPVIDSGQENCYAEAATDYLIARFLQFTEYALNLSSEAFDEVLEDNTGVLDIPNLFTVIATGDNALEVVTDFTLTAIENAVATGSVRSDLVNAWAYTGDITASDLRAWVQAAPVLINGVPLRSQMELWTRALWLKIRGINADLGKYRAQCNSGSGVIPLPTPPNAISLTADGINYLLYQPIRDTVTRISGSDPRPTTLATATNGPVVGIVAEISDGSGASSCGSGNPRYAMDDNGTEVLRGSNMNSGVIGWAITAPTGVAQAIVDAGLVPSWVKDSVTTDTAPAGDIITYAACVSSFIEFRNVWYLVQA